MAFKTIQLLRNNNVITEKGSHADVHAAALAKLNEILGLSTTLDGQPVIVRYKDGTDPERTILGIKGTTANEIFDNVAGNDAIDTAIANLIGGAGTGFDTLGEIQTKIESMDLSQVGGTAGDVITTVSEADGQVSASKSSLSDIALTGYSKTADTGAIDATDTLEKALSKLENKTAAITVASADKTVKVTNPAGGGTDLAVNIDGTTIVKDGTTGILSSGLKIAKETTGLESNVREQYKLVDADGNAISDAQVIKIYKDSALVNVFIGHVDDKLTNADAEGESIDTAITNGTGDAALVYIMQLADGKYKLAAVNVESFLEESEFKNGLEVNNHEVSVKVDSTSEGFLTVSAGGVKLSGVQAAINTAVAGLDATATQDAGADGLALSITEVDGKITAISGSIAADTYDAHGAAATAKSEVIGASTDAKTADTIYGAKAYADDAAATAVNALNVSDTAVANQFVTSVSESKGKISVTRAQPAAAGVTVADSAEYFIATNVEGALAELAKFDCGTY